ncbi:MAG TPA: TonB family protein [Elusimicrobiota bacterium]|nr:TonB family protein [Elusimicrobiota bacterium]
MNRAPEAPPPSRSVGVSVAVHALLLSLALLLPSLLRLLGGGAPPPDEVEIISSYLGTGPAALNAPKALVSGRLAPENKTAEKLPEPVKPPPVKAPEPPKDWVLPGPSTKVAEPPPPAKTGSDSGSGTQTTPGGAKDGEGTAAKTGGAGESGSDEGEIGAHGDGGTRLLAFPKLLNRDEVLANLRRLYPEAEREAGREADVRVMIHVGADGTVRSVDVTRSANAAFDEAAQKVGKLMRFSPAIGLDGRPVPVRLPQPIMFRLEN